MSYRPQRDPFDDGMQSLVSAMNVSHRVPGAKEPDMQNLGKKIINNAKTRPEFARKVTELYTNEDSWLSNFLRKEIAAAKPAPKPEYFGGSPDEKTVAVGESIDAMAGEDNGQEAEQETAQEAPAEIVAPAQIVAIQEVEGTIELEDFLELTKPTKEDKVKAIYKFLPEVADDVVIEKKGNASSIKIYVKSADDIASVKAALKAQKDSLKKEKNARNMNLYNLLDYLLNPKNNAIKVTPTKIMRLQPRAKKTNKRGRSPKPSSGGGSRSRSSSGSKKTPASEAVSMSLNEKKEEVVEVVVKD